MCAEEQKTFNPTADCVVIEEQRKKKAAIKKAKPKYKSVPVMMMKDFSPSVPKGKVRQRLVSRGRVQTLRVTSETTAAAVRSKIQKAFEVSEYTVLECDGSGHHLLKSTEQFIDGEYVNERRGTLYLCENFEVN